MQIPAGAPTWGRLQEPSHPAAHALYRCHQLNDWGLWLRGSCFQSKPKLKMSVQKSNDHHVVNHHSQGSR